jgi:hypothetical protein
MVAPRSSLSPSQRDGLATACEIGRERLDKIADRLSSEKLTIRRSKIEAVMCEEAGPVRGASLAQLVFGIAGTFRRTPSTPIDFIDRWAALISAAMIEDPRLENWDQCRPGLVHLLETESVTLAAKALDISYDFERVYIAGRLLTSIRPVFDGPREEIVGSTIVQTLRVEFIAPNGDQSSISIALDAEDIRRLQDECKRALDKAEKAKEEIEKGLSVEAIIPGEE